MSPKFKVKIAGRVEALPTPVQVRKFWHMMRVQYGTKIVQKTRPIEMRAIARFLNLLGVMDHKTFMTEYATTVGKTLYVPFNIGELDSRWSLWDQLEICAHEHAHVDQYLRDGAFKFYSRYLFSTAKRSIYEADAYRSNMELYYWRHGKLPDIKRLAGKLKGYCGKPVDIEVAEKFLASSSVAIEHGAIINRSSKIAIKWLDENIPALKRK